MTLPSIGLPPLVEHCRHPVRRDTARKLRRYGWQVAAKWRQLVPIVTLISLGTSAGVASRGPGLPVAVIAALVLLCPLRASAQWWSRAPADFEDCAAAAEKSDSKEARTAALAECNAKFAGRCKVGGGYTYYDFMQDPSFDI